MKRIGPVSVVFAVCALGMASLHSARADSIGFSISDNSPAVGSGQLTVTVVDDQTLAPVQGASVSVIDGLGFGPATFRMPVDSQGQAIFIDNTPVPKTVTVSKSGYATLSVVGVTGTDLAVYLKPVVEKPATVVASGTITDWDGVTTDDSSTAYAGIVFRTASATDLLHFQISDFVSPLKDTIDLGSLAGSHQIPSNIVLPDQTVSYLFFSVELNKPTYRLPLAEGQPVSLTGGEIQAGVSDLVGLRNGFNLDILNKVQFMRSGMTETFIPTQNLTHDLHAGNALTATHQVGISQIPSFQADIVAASFTDVNGDKSALVPSDVKVIYNHNDGDDPSTATQNTVTLNAPQSPAPGANLAVAAVAMGTQGQLSGVLVEPAGATVQAGAFLDTDALDQNQTSLPATVTMHTPAQGLGLATFSTDQPVWYVYTLPIAGDVQVPTAKLAAAASIRSYAVNQMEFSQLNPDSLDGSKIMSFLQRFARSSAKIKSSAPAPQPTNLN